MKTIEAATPVQTIPVSRVATHHDFLRPPGFEQVTQRDLGLELLRWPTVLMFPASIGLLVFVALHLPKLAIVPVGVTLATIATITAARRASARVVSRRERATVTALVPNPRSGLGR